jgi:ankyrin repeat protein
LKHFKTFFKESDLYLENYMGNSLLIEAIKYSAKNIVNFLIKNKALLNKVNKEGETPLFFAVKNEAYDLVNILILHGALIDIKNKFNESVYDISSLRMFDFLTFLNESRNYLDYLNNFPLHVAIKKNDIHLFKENLNKINTHKKDFYGYKPLDLAKIYQNQEMIDLILKFI